MTVANFKSLVAAYVNRTIAELTVNSQDLVLGAMNDARRAAQRVHTFELCRTEDAYLSTHAGGATWTTSCKTTPGGATPILMKRLDEVWQYETVSIDGNTYYNRANRVDFSYSGQFKRELSTSSTPIHEINANRIVQEKFAYTIGTKLYVTTINEPVTYKIVGVQWLDDLTDESDPDIFLTYFPDWLKFATLGALNMVLKDSERFRFDAAVIDNLWESVKTLDGQMAFMGESGTLD